MIKKRTKRTSVRCISSLHFVTLHPTTGLNFPETASNYISRVPICVLNTLYSHARSVSREPWHALPSDQQWRIVKHLYVYTVWIALVSEKLTICKALISVENWTQKTYTPVCVFTFIHAHFRTLCTCVCVCVCVCVRFCTNPSSKW